jgi:hypothetical protein
VRWFVVVVVVVAVVAGVVVVSSQPKPPRPTTTQANPANIFIVMHKVYGENQWLLVVIEA